MNPEIIELSPIELFILGFISCKEREIMESEILNLVQCQFCKQYFAPKQDLIFCPDCMAKDE